MSKPGGPIKIKMFGAASIRFFLGLTLCLLLGWVPVWAQSESDYLVLEGANLIDGTGGGLRLDQVVVIEDDRIRQVGARGSLVYPKGAKILDVQGKYVLPGFIDNHSHLRDWHIELFLAYGITTAFDVNNTYQWTCALKRGIEQGEMRGPRVFCSSGALDAPPYPGAQPPPEKAGRLLYLSTVEEARQAAQRLVDEEYVDAIKVYERLSDEQLQAISEVAHSAGIPVVGHSVNVFRSVPRGLDYVEHTYAVAVAASPNPEKLERQIRELFPDPHYFGTNTIVEVHSSMDPDRYDQVIDFLIQHQAYVNPTLLSLWPAIDERKEAFIVENARLMARPDLRYIPTDVFQYSLSHFEKVNHRPLDSWTSGEQEQYREGYRKTKDFLRRFVAAGGKVVPGVDTGTGILPGVSFHQELEMLVGAGLTPMQVIQSATQWSAEVMRIQDRVGSVEAGKLADLVVLNANPLEDIRNTRKIDHVFIGGREIDRSFHADYQIPIPRPTVPVVGRLESVEPWVLPRGSRDSSLLVRGESFGNLFYVSLSGRALPTIFEDSNTLRASIPSELLTRVGTFSVQVVNPSPEGGTSNTVFLMVVY